MEEPPEDPFGHVDKKRMAELRREADRLLALLAPLLPAIAEARRRFFEDECAKNKFSLEEIEYQAAQLHRAYERTISAMEDELGVTAEEIEAARKAAEPQQRTQLPRSSLSQGEVPPTADLDSLLPNSLEAIHKHLPAGWQDSEASEKSFTDLMQGNGFLSLTKNIRRESELPAGHRFRQALNLCQAYLDGEMAYDHFAGATLVPMLTQLGNCFEHLQEVGGDRDNRIRRLWDGPTEEVDSTIMELLTASRCAEMGCSIEFIAEAPPAKTPDLRCHDPFPLVIECKKQRALSDYEMAEETVMRSLFQRVQQEAEKRGLSGAFYLELRVEAQKVSPDDVAMTLIHQRLAAHPEMPLSYPWGTTRFMALPHRLPLSTPTRPYSPRMLEEAFGWKSDVPANDGICCSISNAAGTWLDEVQRPLALVWNNVSNEALRKRSWAPMKLFGAAINQIPPGEFGIVYVAYIEGAREAVADQRLKAVFDRMETWEHSAKVRVPISFLPRLYPRPLEHGQPDFIESSVRWCSGAYGEPALFEMFPATVFTRPPS